MATVYVEAQTPQEAIRLCRESSCGWIPEAVREVDSLHEGVKRWICFESALDGDLWDGFPVQKSPGC